MSRFPSPERYNLDLPGCQYQQLGTRDMVYSPEILCWIVPPKAPAELFSRDGHTPPEPGYGPEWSVSDARSGVVIWKFNRLNFAEAEKEADRLLRAAGWRWRDARLALAAPVASRVITVEKVRTFRKGVRKLHA